MFYDLSEKLLIEPISGSEADNGCKQQQECKTCILDECFWVMRIMISCCILLSFFTVHNIVCSMFWGFPAHILAVVGGM